MVRGRPMGFGEALGGRFDLLVYTVRRLQPATLAICWALNGTLLAVIWQTMTFCDSARCGAILSGNNTSRRGFAKGHCEKARGRP
jgi:hypothetical protein